MIDEPSTELSDPKELFLGYLDHYRDVVLRKADGLPDKSVLPSGWTPLELIKHLAYMERRWIQWGFAGEDVAEPWGDWDAGKTKWQAGESYGELKALLLEQGDRTREIVSAADLTDRAPAGPRFKEGEPTLSWILFHVLQEYTRHAGHLDIVHEMVS